MELPQLFFPIVSVNTFVHSLFTIWRSVQIRDGVVWTKRIHGDEGWHTLHSLDAQSVRYGTIACGGRLFVISITRFADNTHNPARKRPSLPYSCGSFQTMFLNTITDELIAIRRAKMWLSTKIHWKAGCLGPISSVGNVSKTRIPVFSACRFEVTTTVISFRSWHLLIINVKHITQ